MNLGAEPGGDESGQAPKLLSGIRVVDFTEYLAGPYCTWILAQMGAEVIKIERPAGDAMRRRAFGQEGEPVPFHMIHGNKRSVAVDAKSDQGRRIVEQLAARSDVFVENFRPGVVERLGLGERNLRSDHPELVYCSVRGFREGTEHSGLAGVDPVAEALGGLASVTGSPDGPPLKSGFPVADLGAGMWAALGILAACLRRASTGEGEYIRTSLLDGVISWSVWHMAYYLMRGSNPPRLGSAHLYLAPFEFFECEDGEFIVVGVGNDRHWRLLCDVIERKDLVDDPRFSELYERGRRADELRLELAPLFRGRPSRHWLEAIQRQGIPCAPILSMKDVAEGDYARQSGMLTTVDGFAGQTRVVGFPVEFMPGSLRDPAGGPKLGADTADVLTTFCGLDEAQISALARDGVIALG
jgi:crotonobetainyl-CoA:carnitine CoA-transferase CaiB-like acyl-CoA transferase